MPISVVSAARFIVKAMAWVAAVAWVSRTLDASFGLRHVPDLLRPGDDACMPDGMPRVAVIVPARNEQEALPQCLESLLGQDYDNLQIVAVDDRSTDATAQILDTFAAHHPSRVTALHVHQLPAGWLGKTHAMALAARHADAGGDPDWLLFTDADVSLPPQPCGSRWLKL